MARNLLLLVTVIFQYAINMMKPNNSDDSQSINNRGRLNRTPISLFLASVLIFNAQAGPSIYPTGTTRYQPSKAFNSFILFSGGDNIAHLIDMNGHSVHEWKDAAAHSTLIDPAVNGGKLGHVFVTLETTEGQGTDLVPGQVNRKITKTIGELD
jgi:hypothetical protein